MVMNSYHTLKIQSAFFHNIMTKPLCLGYLANAPKITGLAVYCIQETFWTIFLETAPLIINVTSLSCINWPLHTNHIRTRIQVIIRSFPHLGPSSTQISQAVSCPRSLLKPLFLFRSTYIKFNFLYDLSNSSSCDEASPPFSTVSHDRVDDWNVNAPMASTAVSISNDSG